MLMFVVQLHNTVGYQNNAFLNDQDEFSDYDRIESYPDSVEQKRSSAEVAYSRHQPLNLAKLDENGRKSESNGAKSDN